MNRRGVVLIFSLLVTLVLSVLLGAFYFKAVSENHLARRFADSTRAFWLAEAGIAKVKGTSGLSSASGYLDDTNYTYNAVVSNITGNYYNIVSTGVVSLPNGSNVSRTLTATIKTGTVDASKFKYGIETTTDLEIRGSVDINPDDSQKENSTLIFTGLFGISKADMEVNATHIYTDSNFAAPVDGITWVNVQTGNTLTIAGNLTGSGILVVNGNAHFSGTVTFNGIIYVIGTLTMTGTVTTNGSVLAESSTTVDTTLNGNVTINYIPDQISDALTNVQFLTKQIVSWKET